MYNSQVTAYRIKQLARDKNISINDLLTRCGLSKNVISQSSKSEEGIKAKNLYNIAEILNCSVDYLLGRTDVIDVNQNTPGQKSEPDAEKTLSVHNINPVSDDITEMTEMIKKLPLVKRAEVILMIHKMLEEQ